MSRHAGASGGTGGGFRGLWGGGLARFSPPIGRILLTLASKLQISLNPFIQDDINTYYLVNGALHRTYAVKDNPAVLSYRLTEQETGRSAAQLFGQALWKVRSHGSALRSAVWPLDVAISLFGGNSF